MVNQLIYDVGMNDGTDTAYYLARGHHVVAIEADPDLVAAARKRFAHAIAARRLTLVHAAIGETDGHAPFWICPENRVWNSFNRTVAGRDGLPHHAIEVPVRRFADLLAEHGTPYYLKIDIEGHDHLCLEALTPDNRPSLVSWEMSRIEDLFAMKAKGFNAFKCISQTTFQPLELGPARGSVRRDWRFHAHRLAHRAVVAVPAIKPLARAVRQAVRAGPAVELAEHGGATAVASTHEPDAPTVPHAGVAVRELKWADGSWTFTFGSSGPFGPDLPGVWKPAEVIAYEYLDFWLHQGRGTGTSADDWFDVHATTLPAVGAPYFASATG